MKFDDNKIVCPCFGCVKKCPYEQDGYDRCDDFISWVEQLIANAELT